MVKRQKVKVGDILEIPLNEHLTGYVRILYKEVDVLLLECFDLKREKIIMSKRCWNDYVKNGQWKVIDYTEVPSDYQYPVFYGQNALTDKYYEINGRDFLQGLDYECDFRVDIDDKEIAGMEPDGVWPPEIFVEEYLERLNEGDE